MEPMPNSEPIKIDNLSQRVREYRMLHRWDSISEIAIKFGVATSTVWKWCKEWENAPRDGLFFGLSVRAANCLHRDGHTSRKEIREAILDKPLLRITGCGKLTRCEIIEWLTPDGSLMLMP